MMRSRPRLFPLFWQTPLSFLLFAAVVYGLWEGVSLSRVVPIFILPTPLQVVQAFRDEIANGDLLANTVVTAEEALYGFLIALVVGGVGGYAIAHVHVLDLLATPFIAASQAIPIVAVAPLLILLLQTGILSKVVISAIIAVFPLLVATVAALRGVDRDLLDVARVFGASRARILFRVELPLATPTLLSGMKIGLALAITGATVGEFVSANSGLGFMINSAINNFEVATRYVALLTLVILSISLYGLFSSLERIVSRWYDD